MFNCTIVTNKPLIENWNLLFRLEDGYENRRKAVRLFYDFWSDNRISKLIIDQDTHVQERLPDQERGFYIKTNGKFIFSGIVYGYTGHREGYRLNIDDVVSFSRIKQPNNKHNWFDPFLITTSTGKFYRFYAKELSDEMSRLFSDIRAHGGLNVNPGHYLGPSMQHRGYL